MIMIGWMVMLKMMHGRMIRGRDIEMERDREVEIERYRETERYR